MLQLRKTKELWEFLVLFANLLKEKDTKKIQKRYGRHIQGMSGIENLSYFCYKKQPDSVRVFEADNISTITKPKIFKSECIR